MPTATSKRTRTTRKSSKTRTSKRSNFITAGQAWEALGAEDKYKPSDLDAPASNRMLWALNDQGKLAIV